MLGRRKAAMTAEVAEGIAAQALESLAADAKGLMRFLGETGMDPETLRREAGSRAVLSAVLEYMMRDESALLVFAANAGLPPERVAEAAAFLDGGVA